MTKKELGNEIKALRLAKGWTPGKLSSESKIQAVQLKSIEDGERSYTVDSLLKVAEALGVKLELI